MEQADIEDIIYSTDKNQYLKRIPNAPGVYGRCHQNQKYVESMRAFRMTPSNKHILNAPGIYFRWLQKIMESPRGGNIHGQPIYGSEPGVHNKWSTLNKEWLSGLNAKWIHEVTVE